MNIIYSKKYNIKIGLLRYLHPFDGSKFQAIYNGLKNSDNIHFIEPADVAPMEMIDNFLSSTMRQRIRNKTDIFQALEVPRIPLMSFSFLDRKVLSPMRWGIAGTLLGAQKAIEEKSIYWNISGGYHHATQENMEGFCIYNDVGICYQQLLLNGLLSAEDKILIIDTDAHHGNGNAQTFMENKKVTILDVYNSQAYPHSRSTRKRVDISIPLPPGVDGEMYLRQYSAALEELDDDYSLAFVVAGSDTLISDKLGGLSLTIDDVAEREKRTLQALHKRAIPSVILGGGGYSQDSATCVIRAISACAALVI